MIHQVERLGRDGRDRPPLDVQRRVGPIEDRPEIRAVRPRRASGRSAGAGWSASDSAGPPSWSFSRPARASRLSCSSSASSRRRSIRPKSRFSGSASRSSGGCPTRSLIGGREHDQAVHGLDRPARLHEPAGQPVEQLGMGRRLALAAEVAGRADDPLAEVVLPDPVDHHAGGHRVVGPGDPARQLQPAAPRGDRGRLPAREGLREVPRDAARRAARSSPGCRSARPGSRDTGRIAAPLLDPRGVGQRTGPAPARRRAPRRVPGARPGPPGRGSGDRPGALTQKGLWTLGQLPDEGVAPGRPTAAPASPRAVASMASRLPAPAADGRVPARPAGGRPPASGRRGGSRPCRRIARRRGVPASLHGGWTPGIPPGRRARSHSAEPILRRRSSARRS